MKIKDFQIYKYNLSLKDPLYIGNKILNIRQGCVIQISSDSEKYGFGEAAPLSGLHKESLQDTINQIKNIKSLFIGLPIENIFKTIDQLQKENHWFPSVQFAIDSALMNLIDTNDDLIVKKSLPPSVQDKVTINALVTGHVESIKHQIEQSLNKNYRSIKVKVGRQPLGEEITLIRDLQRIIDKKLTLRLDANRGWNFKEAVAFTDSVKDMAIEYIEEPLINPAKLPDLYEKCNLPIALDESLIEMSPGNFRPEEWINTIILKPSLIGSVQKTLQYISLAKKYGIKAVISDTFHSGIGLSFLIRLASIIDDTIPMGFDTYRWLNDDILIDRLPVENGCFDLKTVMDRCSRIDYSKLETVV